MRNALGSGRTVSSAGSPSPNLSLGAGSPTGASGKHLIWRLLGVAWVFRWGCLKALGYNLVLLGLTLSGLGLTGLAIDVIKYNVDPKWPRPRWPRWLEPPSGWSGMQQVALVAGLIAGIAGVRCTLQYFGRVAQARLVQDIVVHLRAKVYDKLQRLSFRFFDANQSSAIINRVTGDVQGVRAFVDGVVIEVTLIILSVVFYLTYMFSLHVRLTLLCLATTPLLWGMSIWFSRIVRPAHYQNRQLFDRVILTLSENVQGVHVVKGFGRFKEEIEKFRRHNAAVRDQKRFIIRISSVFIPLMHLATQLNLALLLAYGGYLVIVYNREHAQGVPEALRTGIPFGTGLVVFAGLLQQFSAQVGNIAQVANNLQHALASAQRVFEVLDAPVEIQSPPDAIRLPKAKGRVTFENVTFGYRPEDPVLQDISFDVQPGMCVAILGATGSGKTTLLSLIPRFYDPQKGRVLVDGIDVRRLDLDDLRRNIGVVFQESFLFSTTAKTIAANIAYGDPQASRERIERAARIAAAHDFIMELPQGYQTILAERGGDLSGGQRQRLAIARAILLEPAILLLDDPTAAIDPQTEHEILQAMEAAMQGRTTFVVAHRLSTLRRADLVIVLENGRIVQMGKHEDLMKQGGPYYKVARLQLADAESLAILGMDQEEEQETADVWR